MKPQSVTNFQQWFEALHTTEQTQVAMMRLEPGRHTGPDAKEHPVSDQVLLVLEGRVSGEIADDKITLQKGEFVVIPARTPHRFYNHFDESVLTFNVYAPPAYPAKTKG